MRLLRPMARRQDGSLPVALLASIVVAGLAMVLTARMIAGEEQVRFDRAFTESFHAADAGVQQALFELNAGLHQDMETTDPPVVSGETTFGDDTYQWTIERDSERSWTVTSQGTQNGVSRTVTAVIEEQPLFFPGAFGDTLIAFNGSSTSVDSYNSGTCTTPAADCEWGSDDQFGTGNGSIATNGVFDFSGNPSLRPGSAFLYDWLDNPAENIVLPDDPFGDRCEGNPCTTTYVSTIDKALEYSSDAQMQFIHSALDDCDGLNQEKGDWVFGGKGKDKNTNTLLEAYEADTSWAVTDPVDPGFENYYCADSLQFRSDTELADAVTTDEPVVIFVRDFVKVENQVIVGCETTSGGDCSKNQTSVPELRTSDTRPPAGRLQIYVAAEEGGGGKKGANITYEANSMFAGVVYGPRSRCGGPGGATVDIFGAIICGSMDNVGSWQFHYDDQLGTYGTSLFGVSYYTEEPGEGLPTP